MTKLIYVTSMGHSGSTLLDLSLGSTENCFSLGEVQFLSWQFYQGEIPTDPQTYCSCGKSFEHCEFWAPIFEELSKEKGINLFKEPHKYDFSVNRHIHRFKQHPFRWFFNQLVTISIQRKWLRFLFLPAKAYFNGSVARNWDLFDRVSKRSGNEFVIDSSKNLNRYLLLRSLRPKDTKLVVLVRDIRGVCSSSHHGLNDEIVRQRARKWLQYHNLKAKKVLDQLEDHEYTLVFYEEFCENPVGVLRNAMADINIPFNDSFGLKAIYPDRHHTIQGNPIRLKSGPIEIRYDQRWKERLNDEQQQYLKLMSDRVADVFKASGHEDLE